jgi:hypothetical protein
VIVTLLASVLPGVLLPMFKDWLAHKSNVETTRRDVALKTLDARMDARRQRAATVQKGMGHWPFWVAWSLFAWPLGLWWVAVMLDTTFAFGWAVPDLPNSIRPWANTIFENIFLPGAGVAAATIVAKAVVRR